MSRVVRALRLRRGLVLLLATACVAALLLAASSRPAGALTDVGSPSWWNGDCDAGRWNAQAAAAGWTGAGAHRLGASYLGVPVCGPRPGADGAPDVLWTKPGWGELEWECPELAFRFMAQVYGVHAYAANGGNVVRNYTPTAGGGLVQVANGVPGVAPAPGDVMSFDTPSGVGHVAVVTASAVDGNGNGTVRLMTQNDTPDGWRTLAVTGWVVQPFGSYAPYGWLHDPLGRGGGPAGSPGPPFHPMVPVRVLDSRDGTGTSAAPWGPYERRDITVAGVAGIPGDADAVLLNLTAVGGSEPSYATVWPTGESQPLTSNLNWPAGDTRPNLVVAKVGSGGTVALYNNTGTVHLVADAVGWFGPGAGDRVTPLAPTRVLDSRTGTGGPVTPWGEHQTRDVVVAGTSGVPAGADAVILNVTVTSPSDSSFLTVWPAGASQPLASNLNWPAGVTRPNLVVAKVGAGGAVSMFNNTGTVDVVADVVGYFAPGAASAFRAVTPARVLDSRDGTGGITKPWTVGAEAPVVIAGRGGVPVNATGVLLNVTATNTTAPGFLTVWPTGTSRPWASNLNFGAGETVPNLVLVPLGADGSVSIYLNWGSADVVADVVGYTIAGG